MTAETPAHDLLTLDEVAEKLRMKRRAVETLIAARKIPVIKINQRVHRFRWRDVETALGKPTEKAL